MVLLTVIKVIKLGFKNKKMPRPFKSLKITLRKVLTQQKSQQIWKEGWILSPKSSLYKTLFTFIFGTHEKPSWPIFVQNAENSHSHLRSSSHQFKAKLISIGNSTFSSFHISVQLFLRKKNVHSYCFSYQITKKNNIRSRFESKIDF